MRVRTMYDAGDRWGIYERKWSLHTRRRLASNEIIA